MIAIVDDAPVASIRGVSAVGRSGRDDTFSQGGGLRADLRSTAPMPNPMRAPTPRSHLRDTTVNCFPRYRAALPAHAARTFVRVVAVAIVGCTLAACRTPDPTDAYGQSRPDQSDFNPAHYGAIVRQAPRPPHKWTKFVSVRGQPEPVPVEWVATPEGRFAHDIVIPNPVPKDSGYKRSMSATEYFLHLCDKEAGEFVFKTVKDVPGFLFMRVPGDIGNYEMKDRYRLEAPAIQRSYEGRLDIQYRGIYFGGGGRHLFSFYEEPKTSNEGLAGDGFVVAFDPHPRTARLQQVRARSTVTSEFGVTWRGVRRTADRVHAIAGAELIVLDLRTRAVLGVLRNFVLTRSGYWLNAASCPGLADSDGRFDQMRIYSFVSKVIEPSMFSREEPKP